MALICTVTLMCDLDSGGLDERKEGNNGSYYRWHATANTEPLATMLADPLLPYSFPVELVFYERERERVPFVDQIVLATGTFYFVRDTTHTMMVQPRPLIPYVYTVCLYILHRLTTGIVL